MEKQRQIGKNTTTGNRGLCKRTSSSRLAEEPWVLLKYWMITAHQLPWKYFPEVLFQDQKALKQSKHSHNRGFWCLQNWRAGKLSHKKCQDSGRWGKGWWERLLSAFHGNQDIPWKVQEVAKLHYLKGCVLLKNFYQLKAKMESWFSGFLTDLVTYMQKYY